MKRIFFLSSLIFFSLYSYTQEQVTNDQGAEILKYSISEINKNEETTNATITESKKELRKLKAESGYNIKKTIDSLTLVIEPYNEEYIEHISIQSLKNTQSTLNGILKNTKSLQNKYTQNIEKLQDLDGTFEIEQKYWIDVSDWLKENKKTTESVLERIEITLGNIHDTQKELEGLLKTNLENMSMVTSFNSEINVLKELIEDREQKLLESYLVRDSEPLWKVHRISKDSTIHKSKAPQIISENAEALNLYVKYNSGIMFTHVILIIMLYLLFLYSKGLSSEILTAASFGHLAYFSKKPFHTAYLYSFLFISFSKSTYPVILLELYLITLFVPMYQLIKTYIRAENRKYILVFICLFSLQLFVNHISYVYISGRVLLLALETTILSFLFYILKRFWKYDKRDTPNFILLRNSLLIAALLFLGSAIANIFGIVRLSVLLSVSTINSIGIGLLIFLFYQISKAVFIVLAEIRPFNKSNLIINNKKGVIRKASVITRTILILLYCRAVLKQFKLYDPLTQGWSNFINRSWELGEVSITIGDFLNFFVLITIAVLVARFIKYLLGNEILPHFIRKRGVPNAISTSIYYILLVIGLFLAAFSTGIEWGKVNLAIGALGVGIGFGLQNVVYNFIAGLILTYERPVQVGDIVQLNTLMGSIKEIGVRSSRVQTYDGAEVVVPNGNLISNEVINWTLSNNHKRQELKFKASTNANPKDIVEILRSMPLENPKVIAEPNPLALFEGYGDDGTLDFRLLFWTHVDVGLSAKSEVALGIYDELQKRGYEIPVQRSKVFLENKQ